jgi:ankyrin-1
LHSGLPKARLLAVRGQHGRLPVHCACLGGDVGCLSFLLADNDLRTQQIDAVDAHGRTPLLLAASQRHVQCCSTLARAGANVNLSDRDTNTTALHWASIWGDAELASLLLYRKANPFQQSRPSLFSPLHCAAVRGHHEVVAQLLADGASVASPTSLADLQDHASYTALLLAVARGHGAAALEIMSRSPRPPSLAGVYANARRTVVHLAALHDLPAVLKALAPRLGKEAKVNLNARDSHGHSALHLAARRGATECAHHLLSLRVELEAQNLDGCTPLFEAFAHGHTYTAAALMRAGASVCTRDKGQRSLIHAVATAGNVEAASLVLRRRHSTAGKGIEAPKSPTASSSAAAQAANAAAQALPTVHAGWLSDVDAQNRQPLHYAAAGGHSALLSLLLNEGAAVDALDSAGRSPLHYAARMGRREAACVLLQNGANLRASCKHKRTPLAELLAVLDGSVRAIHPALEQQEESGNGGGSRPEACKVSLSPSSPQEYRQLERLLTAAQTGSSAPRLASLHSPRQLVRRTCPKEVATKASPTPVGVREFLVCCCCVFCLNW